MSGAAAQSRSHERSRPAATADTLRHEGRRSPIRSRCRQDWGDAITAMRPQPSPRATRTSRSPGRSVTSAMICPGRAIGRKRLSYCRRRAVMERTGSSENANALNSVVADGVCEPTPKASNDSVSVSRTPDAENEVECLKERDGVASSARCSDPKTRAGGFARWDGGTRGEGCRRPNRCERSPHLVR